MDRLPASKNSFWILDAAVVLLKLLGVLALIGALGVGWDTLNDETIDEDWRGALAAAQIFSGIIGGIVLLTIGAAIDVWMSKYERD